MTEVHKLEDFLARNLPPENQDLKAEPLLENVKLSVVVRTTTLRNIGWGLIVVLVWRPKSFDYRLSS